MNPRSRRTSIGLVGVPAAIAVLAMALTRVLDAPIALWDTAWTAACFAASAACLLARGRACPAHRFRWTMWSAGVVSALLAQLVWDALGSALPASPNLSDVFDWLFALLIVVGLLRNDSLSRWWRVVAVVETLPLIAAVLALTLAVLWPQLQETHLSTAGAVSALLYPALFVSAAVVLLQALASGWLPASRNRAPQIVLVGMLLQAVAFGLWSRGLLDQTYTEGHSLLDPLWPLSMFCIAGGGLRALHAPAPSAAREETPSRGGLVPAIVFLVLLGSLLDAVRTDHDGVPTAALAFGLLFCGATIILRGHMLSARLRTLLARERDKMADLTERESELERINERLIEDSRHDPLTGLRNRRALGYDLPRLEAAHETRGDVFAVAVCDVDHFKAYNDQLGHLAGDHALRSVAAIVREHLRDGDLAYRFGGEELLVVLPNTRVAEAVNAAERLRAAIASAALPHPGGIDGILTVSIGVAAGTGAAASLLGEADAALYEAKGAGRNRVVAATGVDTHAIEPLRRSGDEAVPRQLRSMLQVSRAAASGRGVVPVLSALAEAIRRELSFELVCVNLLRPERRHYEVVVLLGDDESHEALFGRTSPVEEFRDLLTPQFEREGAYWLPEGTDLGAIYVYDPEPTAGEAGDPLRWRREDMLLLPVRSSTGEMLAIISVDRPRTGRRPGDDDLAVLMAVADHAGLALERAQRDSEIEGELREQSSELRLAAVMLLAETLDLRDPGTGRHSRTVGSLARQTAAALGLGAEQVEQIYAAGVLHDLGKLGIADAILYKPGPLGEPEWAEMERHPEIGERILRHAGLNDIAAWVRNHHERLDGRGYPDGRAGEEIPLEARILAVCDSYEAMVADRPYRAGRSPEAARAELKRCAGTQFDPVVVEAFIDGLREGEPQIDEVGLLV